MAGPIDSGDDVIANINMVPFIDIALVLLVIFMVTSTYIVQQAIEVNLPAAATGSERSPATIGIVVTTDGGLWLNGERTERRALLELMRSEAAQDGAVQATIAADRGVAYGEVADVLDLVIQAGIRTYALNVERREREPDARP